MSTMSSVTYSRMSRCWYKKPITEKNDMVTNVIAAWYLKGSSRPEPILLGVLLRHEREIHMNLDSRGCLGMATLLDLARQQAIQELELAKDENRVLQSRLERERASNGVLQHKLVEEKARSAAMAATVASLREAVAQRTQSVALDAAIGSEHAKMDSAARIRELEQMVATARETTEARIRSAVSQLEADVEALSEQLAVQQGKAQHASRDAHDAALLAATADARAERLQATVTDLQAELSNALDQGREHWHSLTQANLRAKLAASEAAAREDDLSRQVAAAEERARLAPAEREETMASLRRAFRDACHTLHERSSAIVQREVRARQRAEATLRELRARHAYGD